MTHPSEKRFAFGKNWQQFLKTINEERIREAERNLREFLGVETLENKSFLDVGSGSGLFSLAARRMGADVTSFDVDEDSVWCTSHLAEKFFPNDEKWTVTSGSILDPSFIQTLGKHDVVYAWGVLHHTGDMWQALKNVQPLVKANGLLFIAIYNDCGKISHRWLKRKQLFVSLPSYLRPLYALAVWTPIELLSLANHIRLGITKKYFEQWSEYKKSRGMSRRHDMIDWIGGYPYEFAKADRLVDFFESSGFELKKLLENTGYGCHQIVFQKSNE